MVTEQTRRALFPKFVDAMVLIDSGFPAPQFADPYVNGLLVGYEKGVSKRQTVICFTKWMHGFETDNYEGDLERLRGEVDEAEEAMQSHMQHDAIAEEVADIAIYCYGICNALGIDLDSVINSKMIFNIKREY